jgi:DNA-directed RNA polymerase
LNIQPPAITPDVGSGSRVIIPEPNSSKMIMIEHPEVRAHLQAAREAKMRSQDQILKLTQSFAKFQDWVDTFRGWNDSSQTRAITLRELLDMQRATSELVDTLLKGRVGPFDSLEDAMARVQVEKGQLQQILDLQREAEKKMMNAVKEEEAVFDELEHLNSSVDPYHLDVKGLISNVNGVERIIDKEISWYESCIEKMAANS